MKNYVLQEEVFNIYITKESSNPLEYLLYEVCAYCNKGQHVVQLFNSLKFLHGFRNPFQYQSSFKGEFYGATLKIGSNIIFPAVFPIGITKQNKPIYAGSHYLLLETIAKSLNFKPVITAPADGRACWNATKEGQYFIVGYCQMLKEKMVELSGFADYQDPNGHSHIYFHPSPVIYTIKTVIISARQEVIKEVLAPTDSIGTALLMAVVASVLAISLCLWKIQNYMPVRRRDNLCGIIFQTITTLCLEPLTIRNMSNAKRIALGVWIICSYFVISLIFGEITSMTASPRFEGVTINSIEDMKVNNMSWISFPLYGYDGVFQKKLPQQAERSRRMFLHEGLKFVLDHPKEYVYIAAKEVVDPVIQMYFWDGEGKNPFHFSPPVPKVQEGNIIVVQRKDSPFHSVIDQKILNIVASGLFAFKFGPETLKFVPKFKDGKQNSKMEEEKDKPLTFTLAHLKPSLIVAFCIWMVGVTAFIIELYFPRLYAVIAPIPDLPKQ